MVDNVVYMRPMLPEASDTAKWVAGRPTDELKRLWSSDWLTDADPASYVIEAIHAELNRRGEGRYVAV